MGGSGPHPAEPQEVQCEVGQGLPEIAVFSSCLSTSSRKDGEIRSEGGKQMVACDECAARFLLNSRNQDPGMVPSPGSGPSVTMQGLGYLLLLLCS